MRNSCNIHDTNYVNLDCQNHSITTIEAIALFITNVQNFSLKNCLIKTTYTTLTNAPPGSSIYINNGNTGTIQNNTFSRGVVTVSFSNNIQIFNNTLGTVYQQSNSSFNQIHDNTFKAEPTWTSAAVISSIYGNNNSIQNNTIDGAWNGVPNTRGGADDGIVLNRESQDTVSGNTVNNNWDCGIETVGFIQNTKFTSNKISNAGFCGIGGWFWNSWLGNFVDSNEINNTPYMFALFRSRGLDQNEQIVYFKDNTFSNNTYPNQGSVSEIGSSVVDFQNLPSDIPISKVQLGNNIFKNNDFNQAVPAPILIPISMVVDQGGNKCLSVNNPLQQPLVCVNSTSPTPSPTSTPTPTFTPVPTPTSGSKVSPCNGIGDINQDNIVSKEDSNTIIKFYVTDPYKNPTKEQVRRADVNIDKTIDVADSLLIEKYRLGYITTFPACPSPSSSPTPSTTPLPSPTPFICTSCAADLNKDGGVSITDYSGLLMCFNKKATDKDIRGALCSTRDINGDGLINTSDFNCLLSQFGKRCIQ